MKRLVRASLLATLVVALPACTDPPPPAPAPVPPSGAPTELQNASSSITDPFGRPQTVSAPKAIAPDAARDLVVLGSASKVQIAEVLRDNTAHITNCAKAATPAPGKGIVVVKIAIGGDGRVTEAQTVESSFGRSDVEDCITGAAKTWMFPHPKGGGRVVATVPFYLE